MRQHSSKQDDIARWRGIKPRGEGRGPRTALRTAKRITRHHRGSTSALAATHPTMRRVTVKVHSVRHARGGAERLGRHVDYLARDGAGADGKAAEFFDARAGAIEPEEAIKTWAEDRHHFRIILSPENGDQIDDLAAYARDVMTDVEQDLGTRLEWTACAHHNTDYPHVHVVLRGKRDDGRDLILTRDYIGFGIRRRAAERATSILGARSQAEIAQAREREVTAERFTELDRSLLRRIDDTSFVDLSKRTRQAESDDHLLRRLRFLEDRQLARHQRGRWQLAADLRERLTELQLQGDIVRQLHRSVGDGSKLTVHGQQLQQLEIAGRVVAKGVADELTDRHYVVIGDVNGRQHHVTLSEAQADRLTVGGIARITRHERSGRSTLRIEELSAKPLEQQIKADAQTWLDRELNNLARGRGPSIPHDETIKTALAKRAAVLEANGWGERTADGFRFRMYGLGSLRYQEILRVGRALAERRGRVFHHLPSDVRVTATYRGQIQLHSGRYAVLEYGDVMALVRRSSFDRVADHGLKPGMTVRTRARERRTVELER